MESNNKDSFEQSALTAKLATTLEPIDSASISFGHYRFGYMPIYPNIFLYISILYYNFLLDVYAHYMSMLNTGI